MLAHDAEWLCGWAVPWRVSKDGQTVLSYGTPVLVFWEYDFEAPQPPWRVLAADGTQPRITAEQLEAELAPHLALIREGWRTGSGWLGHPRNRNARAVPTEIDSTPCPVQ